MTQDYYSSVLGHISSTLFFQRKPFSILDLIRYIFNSFMHAKILERTKIWKLHFKNPRMEISTDARY